MSTGRVRADAMQRWHVCQRHRPGRVRALPDRAVSIQHECHRLHRLRSGRILRGGLAQRGALPCRHAERQPTGSQRVNVHALSTRPLVPSRRHRGRRVRRGHRQQRVWRKDVRAVSCRSIPIQHGRNKLPRVRSGRLLRDGRRHYDALPGWHQLQQARPKGQQHLRAGALRLVCDNWFDRRVHLCRRHLHECAWASAVRALQCRIVPRPAWPDSLQDVQCRLHLRARLGGGAARNV